MAADDRLTSLYHHLEWADALVLKAALSSAEAASDSRLLDLLYHLHVVESYYRKAWVGEPLDMPAREAFTTGQAVAAWARDTHDRFRTTLSSGALGDPDRNFAAPWAAEVEKHFGRPASPHSLGESMLQVVLHSAHHRGQALTRLRELGVHPPLVDFIVWLWTGRPDADWTFLEESSVPA
jgi:uncharacterized damage-inducible protein DinB